MIGSRDELERAAARRGRAGGRRRRRRSIDGESPLDDGAARRPRDDRPHRRRVDARGARARRPPRGSPSVGYADARGDHGRARARPLPAARRRSHAHDEHRSPLLDRGGAADAVGDGHHERRLARRSPRSGAATGIAYIHATHGLSLVRVQERETGFFEDLESLLERVVPSDSRVDASASSRALLGPRSEQVPFADGALCLGQWQRILLFSLDAEHRNDWSLTVAGMTPCADPERTSGSSRLLALGLLALIAELAGRSLTHRLDVGRHVGTRQLRARRLLPVPARRREDRRRAHARPRSRGASRRRTPPARAAQRVAVALGARPKRRAPRVRIELSPRLWLLSFVGTASIYLVQADAERAQAGRWLRCSRRGCTARRCRCSPCSRSLVAVRLPRRRSAGSPTTRASRPRRSRTRAGSPRPGRRRRRCFRSADSRAPALAVRARVRVPPAAASGLGRGRPPATVETPTREEERT